MIMNVVLTMMIARRMLCLVDGKNVKKERKLDFESGAKDDKVDKIVLYLERNKTIISNVIEIGPNESKKMIPCFFRVLGVYTKQCNEWFMISKKTPWMPGD